MADRSRTVPLNLQIMGLLGLIVAALGLPVLARPDKVRVALGLKNTPQMTYILRITGTMLAALGLILIVFAAAFWSAQG